MNIRDLRVKGRPCQTLQARFCRRTRRTEQNSFSVRLEYRSVQQVSQARSSSSGSCGINVGRRFCMNSSYRVSCSVLSSWFKIRHFLKATGVQLSPNIDGSLSDVFKQWFPRSTSSMCRCGLSSFVAIRHLFPFVAIRHQIDNIFPVNSEI